MSYVTMTHRSAGYIVPASEWNQLVDNDAAEWPYTAAGQIAIATSATALKAAVPGWDPGDPPTTANANDEEFLATDGMTEFDPDNLVSWAIGVGGQKATVTSGAIKAMGRYKTLPAGDFTIWTRIAHFATDTNTAYAGLCLWEDPTNVAKKLFTYDYLRNTAATVGINIQAEEWTNYTTTSTNKLTAVVIGYGPDSLYLRMRRVGTYYYLDYSHTGLGWRSPNANAAITLSFTPTKMGLWVGNTTGATQYMLFQFWRYLASDKGLDGVMEGNRY